MFWKFSPLHQIIRGYNMDMPNTKNENIKTVEEAEYIRVSHPVLGRPEDLDPQVAPGGPGAPFDRPPQTLLWLQWRL